MEDNSKIRFSSRIIPFLAVLFLFSTIILLLLLLYFVPFQSAANRYVAILNTIAEVPEPEDCALCGQGMKYHAPAILQLNTGLLIELQVYDPQTGTDTGYAKIGEITENQVPANIEKYINIGVRGNYFL